MSRADPGLRFWLSYVEHHGGLVDDLAAAALAVPPEPLQAQLGLPETVTVTADPEAAREDGAVLLAAGHPVLDLSAESVLAAGDVGRQALTWPGEVMPADADLLDQARGAVPVDHGRIDPAAPPIRCYLPVLRAGALIRYVVAGDEAFQERAECWLDAGTRRELPDVQRRALESSVPCAPDGTQVLPFELGPAVEAAHGMLRTGADARLAALDDDGAAARAAEIARTKAYYRDVLDGIERRRSGTAPDRLAALDARAGATRAEQARRLEEIRDKHRARLELRPYRLQLILVPAVVLPVDVLRGSRRYPQRLVWVWPARQFRAVRSRRHSSGAWRAGVPWSTRSSRWPRPTRPACRGAGSCPPVRSSRTACRFGVSSWTRSPGASRMPSCRWRGCRCSPGASRHGGEWSRASPRSSGSHRR